jgi:hypothetical protein
MSSGRCARCGRDRPVGLYDEGATGENSWSPPFASEEAWGSFGGHDVCPQCQRPEERREAAQRIDEMIVREIERRQRAGVSPNEFEAALVNYALAIRDRADGDSPESSPAPE